MRTFIISLPLNMAASKVLAIQSALNRLDVEYRVHTLNQVAVRCSQCIDATIRENAIDMIKICTDADVILIVDQDDGTQWMRLDK